MKIVEQVKAATAFGDTLGKVLVGVVIGALAVMILQCGSTDKSSGARDTTSYHQMPKKAAIPKTSSGVPLTNTEKEFVFIDRYHTDTLYIDKDSAIAHLDSTTFAVHDSTQWVLDDSIEYKGDKYYFRDSGMYYLHGIVDWEFRKFRGWYIDGSPYHVAIVDRARSEATFPLRYEVSAELLTDPIFSGVTTLKARGRMSYSRVGAVGEAAVSTPLDYRFQFGLSYILIQ